VSHPRTRAREAALQILYFCEVGRAEPQPAIEAYFAEHQPEAESAVVVFASELVHGALTELAALDRIIEQHITHWRIERLAVIDRLILRLAVWELLHAADTPAAVILNEALELARRFSGEETVRFVNGVLDSVRRELDERRANA
jgi:N utilization substance protein B